MTPSSHIDWFRHTAPYIRGHKGCTFVVYLGNGALELSSLIHDLALLHSLGVRLILVHATRSEIELALDRSSIEGYLHKGVRVTDHKVMNIVRNVVASQRLLLESQLSMGLPDSPMRGARLRVVSGNFIAARPLGVVDGVDFQFTGTVRRLDTAGITAALDNQAIVLLSPIGFSSTGEVFNLSSDETAATAAISVGADKLIIMDRHEGLIDISGDLIRQCTVDDARNLAVADEAQAVHRDTICRACDHGVQRGHLISFERSGALIDELFTHSGIGTLISREVFERARVATIDDIVGVLDLVRPLEENGALVRRSRELLEQEISNFRVLERDGRIISCAALYSFAEEKMAEVACIATHSDYQGGGRGEYLMSLLEQEARQQGINDLFVLTTKATHWFREQGFYEQPLSVLPSRRQTLYNLQRNSKVLVRRVS